MLFYTVLAVSLYVIVFVIGLLMGANVKDWAEFTKLAAGVVGMAICITLIAFLIRWILRNLRKALFGLACLATLIALFYVEENVRGKWAWNHFKSEWEAKGANFDIAAFVPPSVPDDQNFAMTPVAASMYDWIIDKNGHEITPHPTNAHPGLQLKTYHDDDANTPTNGYWAMGTLTDLRAWQTYLRTPRTNAAGATLTNEFPTAAQPQTPAEDVLLALSKYDSTIEQLREASRMPESRFPLEYDKDNPAMILLPHLAQINRTVQFLTLRSIAELQAGEAEKSAADVNLMLYLIQSVHNEPILISHLVRIRLLNFALQPIYEGLVAHKWTDAQLAEFEAKLAEFNFPADYSLSIRGEAALTSKVIDYLQRTRKVSPMRNINDGQNDQWMDRVCAVIPGGWFHQNQVGFARFYLEQCLPVVNVENREFSPKAAGHAQAVLEKLVAHSRPYNALLYIFLSPVKRWLFDKDVAANRFAFGQTSADLARVAIALERHRLAYGQYPESLAALAPQFIDKLPHDVIGGGELKYRLTNGGFVLYSIGWNEKDDGGTPAPMKNNFLDPDSDAGDWVWRSVTKN